MFIAHADVEVVIGHDKIQSWNEGTTTNQWKDELNKTPYYQWFFRFNNFERWFNISIIQWINGKQINQWNCNWNVWLRNETHYWI